MERPFGDAEATGYALDLGHWQAALDLRPQSVQQRGNAAHGRDERLQLPRELPSIRLSEPLQRALQMLEGLAG
ncbi:hypothetical protein BH11MYX4_BH11MYX4_17440 [soil metagenome]